MIDSISYQSYEAETLCSLLCRSNPNLIELLYVPPSAGSAAHPAWTALQAMRDPLITEKLVLTLVGAFKHKVKLMKRSKRRQELKEEELNSIKIDNRLLLEQCLRIVHQTHPSPPRSLLPCEGQSDHRIITELESIGWSHLRRSPDPAPLKEWLVVVRKSLF
jgi:hypothetical protein